MRWALRSIVVAAVALGASGAVRADAPANTLVWSVRDLDRTYGFIVYRGQTEQGPFRRLNPAVIPAAAGTSEYRYVDHDVRPGVTYYYQIDAVSQAGLKKSLGKPLPKKTAGAVTETGY